MTQHAVAALYKSRSQPAPRETAEGLPPSRQASLVEAVTASPRLNKLFSALTAKERGLPGPSGWAGAVDSQLCRDRPESVSLESTEEAFRQPD